MRVCWEHDAADVLWCESEMMCDDNWLLCCWEYYVVCVYVIQVFDVRRCKCDSVQHVWRVDDVWWYIVLGSEGMMLGEKAMCMRAVRVCVSYVSILWCD